MCSPKNELTCLSTLDNDSFMWHKGLVHAGFSLINKLITKDLVLGLPKTKFKEDKVCDAYV